MSEKEERIVSHSSVEIDAEVPRHKCCWVAVLSLCLLTVNSIVCIHLARRLAYVEGQLVKQCVSTSGENLTGGRFGYHKELEMSHGAKVHPATVAGSKMEESRLYSASASLPFPREFGHQNRKRRSETKALRTVEDAKLIHQERYIRRDRMAVEQGSRYISVTVAGDVMIKVGGRWSPICYGTFWAEEADVACKHLGGHIIPYVYSTVEGVTETSRSPVVSCQGYEKNLGECRIVTANASCEEGHSVRLLCYARFEFLLSGGQKPNEGRVELRTRVLEDNFWGGFLSSIRGLYSICKTGWDIHASDVLCRQLGYKRAVQISVDFSPGSGTILLGDIRCTGNESNILECQHSSLDNCDNGDVVGVVCDVDECNSNPCQNNGTCINVVDHYICQCARGWVGVHCQIKEKLSSMERASRDWAHIEAASDSKGDTHTVKLHDTVLTKHWKQFEPSNKFLFHSGILTVLEEGDYYVYSQVRCIYQQIQNVLLACFCSSTYTFGNDCNIER
ncbi:uncharacterized protein LOC118405899 [Branchiostoma floridae]|uniref:Uncharacterized protein LOC118405899 n=1 Tax=Branchiostoma floridae TaxID=7739 RepID=A0A9J7HLI7_BRAFL|nr:uncharacterized protein LOC118405899 [Branchiostoma floridae]